MLRPDLSSAKIIGMDTETHDPNLQELGNGVYRRDGDVLGFSIAVEGFKDYYNLGHKGVTQEEREGNMRYLKDICNLPVPKVGANIMYDFDWIENFLGIEILGSLHDVLIAEPLLDEYRYSYTLDALSHDYLNKGKTCELPQKFCDENGLKGNFRKWLHRMPYEVVRPYATDDADDALRILPMQLKKIEEQGLRQLYDMERKLIRPLLIMRKNGVRLDLKKRDEYGSYIESRAETLKRELYGEYGIRNVKSAVEMRKLFDRLDLPLRYKVPRKGQEPSKNPTFDKETLEKIEHPVAKKILAVRELETALSFFFDGSFVNTPVKGRIHGEFIPFKSDEGGTVTGRFSAMNPNLQQISSPDRDKARGEPIGRMCRELFLPEEGCDWLKIDYSQIEYRVITHFARGPMSDEMREQYRIDPKTDFHKMAQKFALELTGTELSRSRAKNLGFGSAYYMGVRAMQAHFGWSKEEAEALQSVYFRAFPFIEPTREGVVAVGKGRGYVHTPLGRRARVTPDMRKNRKEYIIFNHLIQGTAADVLKQSLVNIYEAGLMNELKFHVTVHDEYGISMAHTKEAVEAAVEVKRLMETSVPLKVPIIADPEVGPNWGSVQDADLTALLRQYEEASCP